MVDDCALTDDAPMAIPVAFWLLPGASSMQAFTRLVEELCRRHSAPAFTPHVTLHVDCVFRHANIAGLLDEVAKLFEPFETQAGPTGHSPNLFKTLFIPLAGRDIFNLAERLAAGIKPWRCTPKNEGATIPYILEPHLSLLYKTLSEAERAHLAETYNCAGKSFYFDRIAAVTPAPGAAGFSRVEDWVMSQPILFAKKRR